MTVEVVPSMETAMATPGTTFTGAKASAFGGILAGAEVTLGELNKTMAAFRSVLEDKALRNGMTETLATTNKTLSQFGNLAARLDSTVAQNQAEIGKTKGKDEAAGKATMVSVLGLDRARAQAERLLAEGRAAAAAGSLGDGRTRLAALDQLQQAVSQDYQIRIVSRPGEASGVWRVPERNPNGRNFYLIVESVDRNGKLIPVLRTSEEDGTTALVTKWGQRVPQSEFERVRQEKLREGLVGQPIIGQKPPGELQPSFTVPVSGGVILKW
jgi:hypothetical protein